MLSWVCGLSTRNLALSGTIRGVDCFGGGRMKLRTALAGGAVIVGLALYNRRLERSIGEPPSRLGGETRYYRWKGGDLAYSVAGEGEPLLLVHGVYAGASSSEFRKNFEEFVREEIGGSAHLVASSLSAALVVPAAVRSPRLFKKLILICPTGHGILDRPSGRLGDVIYGLFLAPVLGDTLYHTIVSRWG